MTENAIRRPTLAHALETFVLRYVENGKELLEQLAKLAEERLSLSYMDGPRHLAKFHGNCRLKMHASHCYGRDNPNASLEADLALALKRLLEAKLRIPGEPEVVATVSVSEAERAATVELLVDYLASPQTAVASCVAASAKGG